MRLQDNRSVEGSFNPMIPGKPAIPEKLVRRSWLVSIFAALALVVLVPSLACTLSEDAASCSKSNLNAVAERILAAGEARLTASDIALSLGCCRIAAIDASDGTDAQAPTGDQTSSTNSVTSPPSEDRKQRTDVNPLTGMALASQGNYTPLTLDERWKLYLKMTYGSAGPYLSPVVNSLALDQANGTPRQWGGGWPGFGRRLASRAGNAVLQGTFQAPLAAILHEDVRYIPTSQHSFQRRALHAILYSFLTYNNQGHPTLNIANITAFYASTAVTTVWVPGIGNAAKYTFSNASEQIALSFPLNVVQEFWPEIRRRVFFRH
jgi:hypothetical protein